MRAGEWWRLAAHPFVHVTWYHLLLDAGAFFLLYAGLDEESAAKRILNAASCAAGSLIAALWMAPEVSTAGLCGLSGIAHGLMASSALDLLGQEGPESRARVQGAALLAIVVAKSAVEVVTGRCFLELFDFGLLGSPSPACHAGGVLGAVAFFGASRILRSAILLDIQRALHQTHLPELPFCKDQQGFRRERRGTCTEDTDLQEDPLHRRRPPRRVRLHRAAAAALLRIHRDLLALPVDRGHAPDRPVVQGLPRP